MINVDINSRFRNEMDKIFKKIKPKYIIETGTYMGMGTSTIIWNCIKNNNLEGCLITTIEVNPERQQIAEKYFKENNINITSKLGLSIPKQYLLDKQSIQQEFVDNREFTDNKVYYDHEPTQRTELYYSETNFEVEDNLIEKTLSEYNNNLDFVLLDSAGHLGWIEFNYLMSIIKKDCVLMLDDTNHCKHKKTVNYMKLNSNKFTILVEDDEKFGFVIARYHHEA